MDEVSNDELIEVDLGVFLGSDKAPLGRVQTFISVIDCIEGHVEHLIAILLIVEVLHGELGADAEGRIKLIDSSTAYHSCVNC